MWSRIQDAQQGDADAVSVFVALYRPALVRFIRGRGFDPEDAEDLVQEVFIRLFAKEALARADRERGRFRAYLVGITMNVIKLELQRRNTKMRGGGQQPVSLDEAPEVAFVPQRDEDFDRAWAEQLMKRALRALEEENPRQYEALQLRLESQLSPQAISERTGRSNQQVRNDLHRAKKRLARFAREEILRYASSKEEFDDDLALFAALTGIQAAQ